MTVDLKKPKFKLGQNVRILRGEGVFKTDNTGAMFTIGAIEIRKSGWVYGGSGLGAPEADLELVDAAPAPCVCGHRYNEHSIDLVAVTFCEAPNCPCQTYQAAALEAKVVAPPAPDVKKALAQAAEHFDAFWRGLVELHPGMAYLSPTAKKMSAEIRAGQAHAAPGAKEPKAEG